MREHFYASGMAKQSDSDRAEVRRQAVKRFMTVHKIKSVNGWASEAEVSESGLRAFLKGESDSLNLLTLEKLAEAKGASLVDILDLPEGITRGPSPTHRTDRRKRTTDPNQLSLGLSVSIPEIAAHLGAGAVGGLQEIVATPDGQVTLTEDDTRGVWQFPADYLVTELKVDPRRSFLVEVKGDSMSPTTEPGDRVLINMVDRTPSPGGLFALWDGMAVVLKRLEHIPNTDPVQLKIISDNPRHGTYERTIDEVQIIGRAAWLGRRL